MKKIDNNIARERLNVFQKLANEIKMNYRRNLFNKDKVVMFENQLNKNEYFGRDEHLNSVIVKSNENVIGKVKKSKHCFWESKYTYW